MQQCRTYSLWNYIDGVHITLLAWYSGDHLEMLLCVHRDIAVAVNRGWRWGQGWWMDWCKQRLRPSAVRMHHLCTPLTVNEWNKLHLKTYHGARVHHKYTGAQNLGSLLPTFFLETRGGMWELWRHHMHVQQMRSCTGAVGELGGLHSHPV